MSRSFWSDLQLSVLLIGRYMKQSSANRRIGEEMDFVISLMKVRNSKGPITLPWGTPDMTSYHSEALPSTTTRCDLLVKEIFKPLQKMAMNSVMM